MTRLLTFVPALVTLLVLTPSAIHAQDITSILGSGVSASCATALLSLTSNPEVNQCIPILSTASLLSSGFNTTVAQVDPFLASICGSSPCPNSLIASAVTQLQANCSAEINSEESLVQEVYSGILYYPAIYQSICLKNTAGKYCVEETLSNFQADASNKTFSISSNTTLTSAFLTAPNSLVCTPCNKNILNLLANYETANIRNANATAEFASLNSSLSSKCGVVFLDGVTNATTLISTKSSAASGAAFQPTMAALVAVVAVVAAWML
ncbi:hypothetical protein BC937DRAFT_95665 [Endogone sp. FLAS-F59071]|nr:hypothetical protein BC937DRAFT_95665 [Endogone sp. FLAS-F59071]|eukprot:RUS20227.1 hypothetical protein BC937DRAFT_95665 [Endogone sp. FLAS-F59071]